jgi:DNA ligase (NAD+)
MDKFNITSRVEELNKASEAYYNTGQPIMSDTEFDNKLEELRQWEDETGIVLSNSPTHNVGATVLENIKEVTHKTPMLSLEKCHSTEEIVKFANNHNLVASVKLDGLTVRLTYKDGDLLQAESRGNGVVGSDVTKHVKQFTNIPLHINKEGTYVIDGEALIKLDDFSEINTNGEYKNSRNLAAGTLSSLDTSIVKDRKLSWYAWEVVEGYKDNSFTVSLLEALDLGFDVVPFANLALADMPIDEAIDYFLEEAKRQSLPQDGVVFKFDDIKYGKSLGNTSHHFRNGIAYKVFNDSIETKLIDIEWNTSKTGLINPVAIFEPVNLNGAITTRATLHNITYIKNMMLGIGDRIRVYRSNMVIPKVHDSIDKSGNFSIPDKCPICGQPTRIVKENESEVLMCENLDCRGKLLGKLVHAASRNALDIENLSESTIEKFIALKWLNSIQDIYHLSDHKYEMGLLEGFGKKSVEKLLSSIEESRNTNLEHFLYGLSIPLLGKSASKMIAESVDYNFNIFMQQMALTGAKYFKYIPGIGDTLINSLDNYFEKHCSDILQLSKEFIFESKSNRNTNDSLKGLTFVITGSLNHYANRDELKSEIESYGGKVSGSISSKTSYLINNDVNSTSSKNSKAKSLNIPIISEKDFIKMVR